MNNNLFVDLVWRLIHYRGNTWVCVDVSRLLSSRDAPRGVTSFLLWRHSVMGTITCFELFPDKPMLAFRRNRNLRDNLVRANLLKPIQTEKDRKLRRNKCVTPNCKWCQELKTSTSITCTTTGCTYRGPENINCRVNNVVYILTCKQCNKQYIGETGRPFIERWKEHLYDIKVKRPYPVARHFNENDDHKKATFHAKILSMINGAAERATQRHKYKESRWIQTFKSFQPEGINLRE